MKSEAEVQAEIQILGPHYACQLMRNNSGALKNDRGEHVRYGLGNISKKHNDKIKSSDLIGFTTITVTPEMIGKRLAVITAVEVKSESWCPDMLDAHESAQNAFIQWIRSAGGFAGFANSVEQFRRILGV